ncbi:hypothetical protein KC19_VG307800 [Ceratodon purpureus]|uniref:Uncharacterized protein n=1 Tax=Ceratodon purpureus TaxID=3225 RepID=A0A8T0HWB0_CERPU|nr:hypothetical protein KC19_VG307800 [Ceratodon purpureus]
MQYTTFSSRTTQHQHEEPHPIPNPTQYIIQSIEEEQRSLHHLPKNNEKLTQGTSFSNLSHFLLLHIYLPQAQDPTRTPKDKQLQHQSQQLQNRATEGATLQLLWQYGKMVQGKILLQPTLNNNDVLRKMVQEGKVEAPKIWNLRSMVEQRHIYNMEQHLTGKRSTSQPSATAHHQRISRSDHPGGSDSCSRTEEAHNTEGDPALGDVGGSPRKDSNRGRRSNDRGKSDNTT